MMLSSCWMVVLKPHGSEMQHPWVLEPPGGDEGEDRSWLAAGQEAGTHTWFSSAFSGGASGLCRGRSLSRCALSSGFCPCFRHLFCKAPKSLSPGVVSSELCQSSKQPFASGLSSSDVFVPLLILLCLLFQNRLSAKSKVAAL